MSQVRWNETVDYEFMSQVSSIEQVHVSIKLEENCSLRVVNVSDK